MSTDAEGMLAELNRAASIIATLTGERDRLRSALEVIARMPGILFAGETIRALLDKEKP